MKRRMRLSVLAPDPAPQSSTGPSYFVLSLLCYGPIALLASGWIFWQYGADELSARLLGADPSRGLLLGLLVGIGIVAFSQLLSQYSKWARRLERSFIRSLGPISWPLALGLAATSAIGEELLFRACLQPELGWVTTSILFGLCHWPLERGMSIWPFYAALMGLLLGWLYERSGGALAPTTAHFVVNAINLTWIGARARATPAIRLTPSGTSHPQPRSSDDE